jgi:hypothetical protein
VGLVKLAAALPELADHPSSIDHPIAHYFLDALATYPQLYGMYIGYGDGGFFQVVQFAGVDAETLKRLGAPAGSAFGIRDIRRLPNGAREQKWAFLDSARQPLGAPLVEPAAYVLDQPGGVAPSICDLRNGPYIFSSLRAPGRQSPGALPAGRKLIIAADIIWRNCRRLDRKAGVRVSSSSTATAANWSRIRTSTGRSRP